MQDEAAFLAAIRAQPGDDAVRLAYADWRSDQGRPGGDCLRAETELAAVAPTDPRRAELQARLRDACAGLDREWLAKILRAPIENCSIEWNSRCPRRWENLEAGGWHRGAPLDPSERLCSQCGSSVVLCSHIGVAKTHVALGHRVAIDPRLARTLQDLESKPDEVIRYVHTAAYDRCQEDHGGEFTPRFRDAYSDPAIAELRRIFSTRGFTDADADLIRTHAPDAPDDGASILQGLLPWTRPIVEAMLDQASPSARQVAVRCLSWGSSHRQIGGCAQALVRRLSVEADIVVRCEIYDALIREAIDRHEIADLEPVRSTLLCDLKHAGARVRELVAVILCLHRVRGADVAAALLDRLAVEENPHVRRWLVRGKAT